MFARHLSLVSSVKKTTHTSLTDTFIPELQLIISHRQSSYGGHTLVCLNLASFIICCLVNLWVLRHGLWTEGWTNSWPWHVRSIWRKCVCWKVIITPITLGGWKSLDDVQMQDGPKYHLLRLDVIWPMHRCLHESLGGWVWHPPCFISSKLNQVEVWHRWFIY